MSELDSVFIVIHPPLAILGYAFSFIALASCIKLVRDRGKGADVKRKDLKISLTIAWVLTFLGLVTGMIWAQIAWGRFWQWDPKETATLIVFLTLTLSYILNYRKVDPRIQLILLLVHVLSIFATISISFIDIGLHSFGH